VEVVIVTSADVQQTYSVDRQSAYYNLIEDLSVADERIDQIVRVYCSCSIVHVHSHRASRRRRRPKLQQCSFV
jgi:hypothetical protein